MGLVVVRRQHGREHPAGPVADALQEGLALLGPGGAGVGRVVAPVLPPGRCSSVAFLTHELVRPVRQPRTIVICDLAELVRQRVSESGK